MGHGPRAVPSSTGSRVTTTTSPIDQVVSPSAPNVSTSTFAKGILVGIKAPVTNNNIANIQRWLGLEQGSSAANWFQNQTNPLGVETNGSVHPFATPYEGVVATVNTLLGSSSYQPLVSSLRNNAPAPVFSQALVAAPWQSGKSGGTTYSGKTASQIAAMTPFSPDLGKYVLSTTNPQLTTPGQLISGIASPVTGAYHAVTSVSGFLGKITNPSNLKNVGIFSAGIALTIVGLVILLQGSKQVRMAESTAVRAAT